MLLVSLIYEYLRRIHQLFCTELKQSFAERFEVLGFSLYIRLQVIGISWDRSRAFRRKNLIQTGHHFMHLFISLSTEFLRPDILVRHRIRLQTGISRDKNLGPAALPLLNQNQVEGLLQGLFFLRFHKFQHCRNSVSEIDNHGKVAPFLYRYYY